MDEYIAQIAAKLDGDRLEAAEAMTFAQRLLAGAVMFDLCVAAMRAGVRITEPQADAQSVEARVLERLRNARRFETRV